MVRHMAEEGRVAVRNVRRHSKDDIEALKHEVSDDEIRRGEKELQELTDQFVHKIDESPQRQGERIGRGVVVATTDEEGVERTKSGREFSRPWEPPTSRGKPSAINRRTQASTIESIGDLLPGDEDIPLSEQAYLVGDHGRVSRPRRGDLLAAARKQRRDP